MSSAQRVYYVTKKYWDSTVKHYVQEMVGADLEFEVPARVVEANAQLIVPTEVMV